MRLERKSEVMFLVMFLADQNSVRLNFLNISMTTKLKDS